MPIKVRCPDCEKVLNAPDRAMGKALKCPDCNGRVRVPVRKKKRPQQRRRPPESEPDDGDLLGGIDLRNAEDRKTKLCPKCAKIIVDEEEVECPYCGVNIETGGLSERQKKKRQRKGPDPEEFFQKVWKNSMNFVKKNRSLVVRSALVWATALALAALCFRCANYCFTNEYRDIMSYANTAGITITNQSITVNGTPSASVDYRGTKYKKKFVIVGGPRLLAMRAPSTIFWNGLGLVCHLSCVGWGVYLTNEIIKVTMAGEKRLDRIQGDFFTNVTQGIKFYFWPIFIFFPLSAVPGLIGLFMAMSGSALSNTTQVVLGSVSGVPFFFALFLVPAAAVHMSQTHTYPGWLIVRVARGTFKTFGASMAMTGLLFGSFLILIIAGVIAVVAAVPIVAAFLWLMKKIDEQIGYGFSSEAIGLLDLAVQLPILAILLFIIYFITFILFAFPMVYTMRALGLYGLYHRDELELVPETTAFEPTGFGPRYLAYAVDSFVLFLVSGVVFALGLACSFLGPTGVMLRGLLGLAHLAFTIYYWAGGESGQARATPGKWSLGMIVVDEKNQPISFGQAFVRMLCSWLSAMTLYIGFALCLFDPEKRAMQDKMSGTRVVWKGDDDRS